MIDRNHALPLTRQAELVGISRGNVYYLPRAVSEADLRLMKRIDVLNLAHPFAGSRMLRDMLCREGFAPMRPKAPRVPSPRGTRACASPSWRGSGRPSGLLGMITPCQRSTARMTCMA